MEKEKYIKITNTNVLPYVGVSHNPSIKKKVFIELKFRFKILRFNDSLRNKRQGSYLFKCRIGTKHVNEEEVKQKLLKHSEELFEAEFIKQKTSA